MNITISLIEDQSAIRDKKENNEREILTVPLGDLCFTTSGGTPSRKNANYYIGDIPWVKSGELEDNLIIKTDEYISEEAIKNSSAKIFPKGTLLIALYGATIGKLAFLGIDAATNQAICGIFSNEYVNLKYIYYYLRFQRSKLIEQGIGGAQPNISQDIIRKQEIPFFSLAEQHRIVAKIEELFSSLDNGIQNLKTAQQQLKIYRQAVLKWAFEGKFLGEISNDKLPEHWTMKKINSLCEVVRGGSPRPAGDVRYYEGNIPFLKVADLTKNDGVYLNTHTFTIKEAGLTKTRYVKSNTLLLSNSGATLGVPKICTFPTTFNDGIAAFLGLEEDTLLYHYYFWVSKTKELRAINQGAAQPNLNTGIIGQIEIPIGTPEDMKMTVKEIESRLSVCDKLEETIQTSLKQAETLRQSILKKAFSGQLVPQDPNDEPASLLLQKIQTERTKNTPKSPRKPRKNRPS